MFDVSVDEERVELAEKIQQAKPVSHRLLVFDDILFTKETIRYMPTFSIILAEYPLRAISCYRQTATL